MGGRCCRRQTSRQGDGCWTGHQESWVRLQALPLTCSPRSSKLGYSSANRRLRHSANATVTYSLEGSSCLSAPHSHRPCGELATETFGVQAEACPPSLTAGRAPGTEPLLAAPSPALLPCPIKHAKGPGCVTGTGASCRGQEQAHSLPHPVQHERAKCLGSDVSYIETELCHSQLGDLRSPNLPKPRISKRAKTLMSTVLV